MFWNDFVSIPFIISVYLCKSKFCEANIILLSVNIFSSIVHLANWKGIFTTFLNLKFEESLFRMILLEWIYEIVNIFANVDTCKIFSKVGHIHPECSIIIIFPISLNFQFISPCFWFIRPISCPFRLAPRISYLNYLDIFIFQSSDDRICMSRIKTQFLQSLIILIISWDTASCNDILFFISIFKWLK